MQLIARVNDTHANLWSAPLQLRPPAGDCQLPVTIRFIENQAVVTGYSDAAAGPATGLKVGDVIDRLDGSAGGELVDRWEPYYPASNGPTRLRDIARAMSRGPACAAGVGVRRAGERVRITAQRQPLASLNPRAGTDARPSRRGVPPALRRSRLSEAVISAGGARRQLCRPRQGDARAGHRYPQLPVGVRGVRARIAAGGSDDAVRAVHDRRSRASRRLPLGRSGRLSPQQPHYAGKVVILVDEISLSQAEYTAMAFRANPRAVVVGSTTAGADGNVSPIPLPGGLSSMISGIGVFYPDKTPTQRVGIGADVEARPTIAGIRAGRDEVLEEALRQILGRETPAERIENMARPRP